jgi:ferritin
MSAKLILEIIEDAGYEYENIDKVIQEEIAKSQNIIKQIQEMNETEFLNMVSKN